MTFSRSSYRIFNLLAASALLGGVFFGPKAAVAAELSEILERGYLIVGIKDNLRPLGFRNEQGNLEGFEVELARYLAAVLLGNPEAVEFQPLTNPERLPAVLDGEVDLTIARITATGVRSRLVDFSLPYYIDGTAFITRSAAVQELQDLQQQPIAVLEGADTIAIVRSLFPNARLVGVSSYEAAKLALERGEAAAFAADASVLTGWVQEAPEYRLLPQLISAEPLAIALPRGLQYDDLRRRVDQAIGQWQKEGGLRQQVLRWGLPEAGVPDASGFGVEE
ncbi:transporter substrate-binding domain-containing protein [Phormidium tenue FACHB-886]|nr:transporter substrate-binding domain-containing protein [Phormidium tenue FACHB-886]